MSENKNSFSIKKNLFTILLVILVIILSIKVFFPGVITTIFGKQFNLGNSDNTLESTDLSTSTFTSNGVTEKFTKSSVSLLVENADYDLGMLREKINSSGGEVLYWNNNRGTIDQIAELTVRIPKDYLETLLSYLRENSVRIITEDIKNTPFSDKDYLNIDERIKQLQETIITLEEIKSNSEDATKVMNIQRQIDSVQEDIEAYNARKTFLDNEIQTVLLQINLTTDEQNLPYLPSDPWQPETIFKKAVRSLLITTQNVGTLGIWIFVYSPIILGLATIAYLLKSWHRNSKKDQ